MTAEPVFGIKARAGEGVIYDAASGLLYWVDILDGQVHASDPGSGRTRSWNLGQPVGCVAVCRDGSHLVAGVRDGFGALDLESGTFSTFLDPEPHRPDNRFNDGACDAAGRLWAGTMRMGGPRPDDPPLGTLYLLDAKLDCRAVLDGFHIVNGLALAPEGDRLFVAETHGRGAAVWSCRFDPADGAILDRHLLFNAAAAGVHPDGAAVDEAGCYWVADVGGWRVLRIDPHGRVDRTVELPVEKPTKPAFVDDVLYITSLAIGLDPAKSQPLAGCMLAVAVGIKGPPHPRFAGRIGALRPVRPPPSA